MTSEWQTGPGCPCTRCWSRRACARADRRCQEWIAWFYRSFRVKWRELRTVFGIKDDTAVWQYRAPYERDDAACGDDAPTAPQEKILPAPSTELGKKLRELDRLVEKAWRKEKKVMIYPEAKAEIAQAMTEIVGRKNGVQTRLAREAGVKIGVVCGMMRAHSVPTWENWERIREAIVRMEENKNESEDEA